MNKKEQQAIDFLRSMERDDPMCLGFSGGKDSVVILDLAERSGIKYNASYANTTVDPPGTISFIKKNSYRRRCLPVIGRKSSKYRPCFPN